MSAALDDLSFAETSSIAKIEYGVVEPQMFYKQQKLELYCRL